VTRCRSSVPAAAVSLVGSTAWDWVCSRDARPPGDLRGGKPPRRGGRGGREGNIVTLGRRVRPLSPNRSGGGILPFPAGYVSVSSIPPRRRRGPRRRRLRPTPASRPCYPSLLFPSQGCQIARLCVYSQATLHGICLQKYAPCKCRRDDLTEPVLNPGQGYPLRHLLNARALMKLPITTPQEISLGS
jgi:hypothetical protein